MKWVEITKEAFRALVTVDCKCFHVDYINDSVSIYWNVYGCITKEVSQATSGNQYFIADINS